jgi:hypothetical protein
LAPSFLTEKINTFPNLHGHPDKDHGPFFETFLYSLESLFNLNDEKTIVSIIDNNGILDMFRFDNNHSAEAKFIEIVADEEGKQLTKDEIDCGLSDGYWECENGKTICINHPRM